MEEVSRKVTECRCIYEYMKIKKNRQNKTNTTARLSDLDSSQGNVQSVIMLVLVS